MGGARSTRRGGGLDKFEFPHVDNTPPYIVPDHTPARCPFCGRGDCPEDPPARFRADWLVLIVAIAVVAAALGSLAWWIGAEALDVMARGAGALWP